MRLNFQLPRACSRSESRRRGRLGFDGLLHFLLQKEEGLPDFEESLILISKPWVVNLRLTVSRFLCLPGKRISVSARNTVFRIWQA